MTVVVDASVVIKWFVREPLHEEALRLLDTPKILHAPELIVPEVSNVAWKKVIRNEIGKDQAVKIAEAFRGGIPILHPSVLFCERAIELALALGHPVYDCLYLACAETIDGILVTADNAFFRSVRKAGLGERVRLLGRSAMPMPDPVPG
jgi:predicted nucleic acid-binding protein